MTLQETMVRSSLQQLEIFSRFRRQLQVGGGHCRSERFLEVFLVILGRLYDSPNGFLGAGVPHDAFSCVLVVSAILNKQGLEELVYRPSTSSYSA